MAEKDIWDKTEVVIKLIGGVVLVAIPVMINIGADRISQSMERGKLVDSLLAELTDEQKKMRRDLALIALDAAVPPPERCAFLGFLGCGFDEAAPDMVADVAVVLWRELDKESDQTQAARIIKRRRPETHAEILAAEGQVTSDVDPDELSQDDIRQRSQKAAILSKLYASGAQQPDEALSGVRAVYLQYRADGDRADRVRQALQGRGVSVPRAELIRAINQSDIRYPGPEARNAALRLRDYLKSELQIEIADDKLIDLSAAGYDVPSGQFEVWLNE